MKKTLLPITEREIDGDMWQHESNCLTEAGMSSGKTETTYRSSLRIFADWLQHYGKAGYSLDDDWPLSPQGLTTAVILEFFTWLARNKSASTYGTYKSGVMGYLIHLEGRDELPAAVQISVIQRQQRRNAPRQRKHSYSIELDEERQRLLETVKHYDNLPLPETNDKYNRRLALLRDRALLNTMYSTAARISEIAALDRKQVKDGRAETFTLTGKGSKPRTIHLQKYARDAIRAYLKERKDNNPALFLSHSRNAKSARLSVTSIHNTVKAAVLAQGLDERLSAHDFRHYRATTLLRAGVPLEVVQEYLGHESIQITRDIYAPVLGSTIVGDWLSRLDVAPADA
jgi:site-specific recombinase XerD